MKIDILTLFPGSAEGVLGESIIGRAADKGIVSIRCRQIRDYTENRQRQVDDYPYGGGWGCVMMAQPLWSCVQDVLKEAGNERVRVICMSPQGKPFTQKDARRLVSDYDRLILVCGHYEGIDERFIEECVDEEISIGDFVLTGGEIPAMAVADAVCRLVPGVLADEECYTGESHWDGLLEYPQYTRPEVWMGRRVPEVLQSGNHAEIKRWRRKESIMRTLERRPDILEAREGVSQEDRAILREIQLERLPIEEKQRFDCRKAVRDDLPDIMAVILEAKDFLYRMGVDQWNKGYPDEETMADDIRRGECWLFSCGERTAGVITICQGDEPSYLRIHGGEWITDGPYASVHRIAVGKSFRGKGLAAEMVSLAEDLALGCGKASIRSDTHRSNKSMRSLLEKSGYTCCGVVYLSEAEERLAFEKRLVP